MPVDPVLFHGHLEHLTGAGAVDVATFLEDLLPPRLPGVPGDDAGLDGGEVGHQELSAIFGDERGADQLGERVRHVLVQELHGGEVTGADKGAGLCEIRKMILGQVLQLDVPPREPACPRSTEELEHPTGTAVGADGILHRLVFPDGGLGQLLPQGQHLPQLRWGILQKLRHGLLVEGFGLPAVVRKPLLHLLHTVGVLQRGHPLHGGGQLLPGAGIHVDSGTDQLHIQPDATVVDFLIDVVFLPDLIRDREFSQPLLNAHLGLHVAQVVALKGVPFVRRVEGAVPGALAIGLRRRTGLAEEFDQLLAFGQLLLFQPQHGTDTFQGERQAHCGSPDHRTAPALRVQEAGLLLRERMLVMEGIKADPQIPKIAGQADSFKAGVEGPLGHSIVGEGVQHIGGDLLTTGQIYHLHRTGVRTVPEEQNFKVGRLTVTVHTTFLERDVTVGLDID